MGNHITQVIIGRTANGGRCRYEGNEKWIDLFTGDIFIDRFFLSSGVGVLDRLPIGATASMTGFDSTKKSTVYVYEGRWYEWNGTRFPGKVLEQFDKSLKLDPLTVPEGWNKNTGIYVLDNNEYVYQPIGGNIPAFRKIGTSEYIPFYTPGLKRK
jgi:hypothetical protein